MNNRWHAAAHNQRSHHRRGIEEPPLSNVQRILQPGDIEALDRTRMPRLRAPDPAALFSERAARLRQLAEGNPIADYLNFVATLVDAQRAALKALPPTDIAALLAAPHVAQAQAHGLPLWPATEHLPVAWRLALASMIATLDDAADVPQTLRQRLDRLALLDEASLDALAFEALTDTLDDDDRVLAPLLMAALQAAFAERASRVPEAAVPYLQPATLCPVCASEPVAGVVRIGGSEAGLRFMHCGLCATEWHTVRVKCSVCESTEGIRYQGIEGAGEALLAETCDACHSYRKLANQEKDPLVEPLADDLASLTLDLLMAETPYARASANPLLPLGEADD